MSHPHDPDRPPQDARGHAQQYYGEQAPRYGDPQNERPAGDGAARQNFGAAWQESAQPAQSAPREPVAAAIVWDRDHQQLSPGDTGWQGPDPFAQPDPIVQSPPIRPVTESQVPPAQPPGPSLDKFSDPVPGPDPEPMPSPEPPRPEPVREPEPIREPAPEQIPEPAPAAPMSQAPQAPESPHNPSDPNDDEALTIGRGRGNSIVLDDMLVSRHHVRITADDDGLVLQDLGSRNGTYVNGHRVERTALHEGDRLGIGATTFEVRDGWLVSV